MARNPTRIGRYDLVTALATGGMGRIYLGRASGIGGFERKVVIKTLEVATTTFQLELSDDTGKLSSIIGELGQIGLMGVTVPEQWDGAGADYVAYALALEEIGAGDGAVATVMSGHNSVGCMP